MKLTKAQAKAMTEIDRLVSLERRLTHDERLFILHNYQEGAGQLNSLTGAFFTPTGLARDFSIEVPGGCNAVVDLCAGIGSLAYACEGKAETIVCVERCEEYVRVGRKVMPDATWVHADVFSDWWQQFGHFDAAFSNPPFGRIKADAYRGRYLGTLFEYKVIDLASRLADWGTFIVPQASAPFRYSGVQCYREEIGDNCRQFIEQTSIELGANCGIDTTMYRNEWHGVSPTCEIVTCDFTMTPQTAVAETSVREALAA